MRRRWLVLAGAAAVLGGLSAVPARAVSRWAPQAARFTEGRQLDQPVTMADGTVLRADVYYPVDPRTGHEAAGPFPALLQQTPYGKEAIASGGAMAGSDVSTSPRHRRRCSAPRAGRCAAPADPDADGYPATKLSRT